MKTPLPLLARGANTADPRPRSLEVATEPLLTPVEAARMLSVSKAGMYNLLTEHAIAHYRFGRLIRLRSDDVEAFLATRRVERAPVSSSYGRYPSV